MKRTLLILVTGLALQGCASIDQTEAAGPSQSVTTRLSVNQARECVFKGAAYVTGAGFVPPVMPHGENGWRINFPQLANRWIDVTPTEAGTKIENFGFPRFQRAIQGCQV